MELTELDGYGEDWLMSDDVYLINTGFEVFTWVGAGASLAERKNSLSYACNYLNKTETPWLPISVVAERRESQAFLRAMR